MIKFTTLFGLLAVEIAMTMTNQGTKTAIGAFFFIVALIFVYRSFYGMRVPEDKYSHANSHPPVGRACGGFAFQRPPLARRRIDRIHRIIQD